MFIKSILSTALTSEAADRLFSNITAANAPDQSFLATLRALLRNRLPHNETVQLTCTGFHLSANDISAATTLDCMNWFIPDMVRNGATAGYNIFIVYTANPGAGEKMLESVRANIGAGKRYICNYFRQEDLRVFYARKLNALFYTDDTKRNTVIFIGGLELRYFHALQMMIPKYLSGLFADNPLTETETALLKSLGNKSAVEYETLIGEFAKDLDIRSEIIRIKLAGFETMYERMRLDEIKNEIDKYQQDYDSYLTSLREVSQKIQNCQYTLAGLECVVNTKSGDSELAEYFMCNKNLTIIKVNGTALEFVVHGYADIYDEDAFNQYVGNHKGYLYAGLSSDVTKPQMEKAMRRSMERLDSLRAAVVSAGHDGKELKTTSFSVDTKYENYKALAGRKERLVGYNCTHSLMLEFGLDMAMLGATINAIVKCEAVPTFKIRFSVKDPGAVTEQLLACAIENARWKAAVLAKSANVKLGAIQRIDYNWGELDLYSSTELALEDLLVSEVSLNIVPKEINMSDSAAVTWSIE